MHDPEVFADFYDVYVERMLRFIARRTFDVQVGYDLHAEVFALAFERRHQFRGSTVDEEAAWLFMLAKREISRYIRKGGVRRAAMERLQLERPALDDEAIERFEELADLDSLRGAVGRALTRLPESQQIAVRMRVVDELEYDEIAARLNVSYDNARTRVSRGLKALADALGPDDYLQTETQ